MDVEIKILQKKKKDKKAVLQYGEKQVGKNFAVCIGSGLESMGLVVKVKKDEGRVENEGNCQLDLI